VGTAGVYLGWALTSEEGYAAGGRVLKARYGFLAMPHAERQSLRKLAMMKAAGQCEWELDETFWSRVYQLYVGEERPPRWSGPSRDRRPPSPRATQPSEEALGWRSWDNLSRRTPILLPTWAASR
jgi:hypothetical protein